MQKEVVELEVPRMEPHQCKTQLIWANERDLEAQYTDHKSSFQRATVCWLIERGSVRVVDGIGDEVTVQAGQWIFLKADDVEQHFSPRARLISLRFVFELLDGTPLFLRKRSQIFEGKAFPWLEKVARVLIDACQQWGGGADLMIQRRHIPLHINFQIEAAFYGWLSAYSKMMFQQNAVIQRSKLKDDRVYRALKLIDEHPMSEPFSERELASHCGLSSNQLIRIFKKDAGLSPFKYYDRRRKELACYALHETDMQVKEIAYELGFSSSPHFTNWFKQRMGQSPRAFRSAGSLSGV